MTTPEKKIVQYLDEAHAAEVALSRVLLSQIAMTPVGGYRDALERHLAETRDHARRTRDRARDLGRGGSPLQAVTGVVQTIAGQALALGKTPLDVVRGNGGEEKVLKNAKDAAATEALEIATYTSIERLARSVGDDETADLAVSIRADEERMLRAILREIPRLTGDVVGAEIKSDPSYDLGQTGAGQAAKRQARRTRRAPASGRRSRAKQPWPGYDEQTVEEITTALSTVTEAKAKDVRAYERAHKGRAGVIERTEREAATA